MSDTMWQYCQDADSTVFTCSLSPMMRKRGADTDREHGDEEGNSHIHHTQTSLSVSLSSNAAYLHQNIVCCRTQAGPLGGLHKPAACVRPIQADPMDVLHPVHQLALRLHPQKDTWRLRCLVCTTEAGFAVPVNSMMRAPTPHRVK